jgi:UDP-GlcNAc3NAcA epimerase
MSIKIATIVGARPQFIKSAVVSRNIRHKYSEKIEEILIHTGQHYDDNMSKVFFDELNIPSPKFNLGISGGLHGDMTGRMLESIEKILIREEPDWVLLYGDTNSTLAGALAAVKMQIKIAHVEAGLRSFNMQMPEEINRILTDRVSNHLYCPTEASVKNLADEGIKNGVFHVGDVMYDAAVFYGSHCEENNSFLKKLDLSEKKFVLATCHRAENTNELKNILGIIEALVIISADMPVVFPIHPRTKVILSNYGISNKLNSLRVIPPVSFREMALLEKSAFAIVTDSGGIQKEAYFYGVPCLTTRYQTEWIETVELGWNRLVGAEKNIIVRAFREIVTPTDRPSIYGDGNAADMILSNILNNP